MKWHSIQDSFRLANDCGLKSLAEMQMDFRNELTNKHIHNPLKIHKRAIIGPEHHTNSAHIKAFAQAAPFSKQNSIFEDEIQN